MIRTRLTYHAPDHVEEVCELLLQHGDTAAVLGGGTVLLPAMGRDEVTHEHVVDLRRLGLADVTTKGDAVEVGAMTTYSDLLAADVDGPATLLTRVAGGITGGPQLRNQGTVGGSASHANPASDIPAVLVALGAVIVVQGTTGTRELPAADFFRDAFQTALDTDEVLTGIRVPRHGVQLGYYKLKLSESSWPIATASARVDLAGGRLTSATVTLGGVCRTPVTIDVAACLDENGEVSVSDREWAQLIDAHTDQAWQDELAPASYRRQVAGVVARRALDQTTRDGER